MATIGRNDPCPCGSGKKYKKCCLLAADPALPQPTPARAPANEPTWIVEDDGLDDLSNSVLDLVKARRFDEALAACRRLLEEFPDVVDGFERSGMVYAATGDHARAADFYRKTLEFVTHPSRREDYEGIEFYEELLKNEEALAGAG